jgi:hypothetical protein
MIQSQMRRTLGRLKTRRYCRRKAALTDAMAIW